MGGLTTYTLYAPAAPWKDEAMKTKLLLIAGLALAIPAPLARAQEEWGEHR